MRNATDYVIGGERQADEVCLHETCKGQRESVNTGLECWNDL